MSAFFRSTFSVFFLLSFLVGCGNSSNKSSPPTNPSTPNGPLVPLIGNWKGSCLKSGNESSMNTRLVFNANGQMNILNYVFLLKKDCAGTEDYSYRFTGNYQVGDVRQSSPTYIQNMGATFSSDIFITLKTDSLVQAFNGGPADTDPGSWKINEEQKASPSVATTYTDALNNLKSVFSNNYYKVNGNLLSIGNTTVTFTRE